MSNKRTLLATLESMPPYKVRVYARVLVGNKQARNSRAMKVDEIVARSGLSREKVKLLSQKRDWFDTKVEDMLRFCAACGVELMRLKSVKWYIHYTNGLKDAPHVRRSQKRKFFYSLLNGERNWRGIRESTIGAGTGEVQA